MQTIPSLEAQNRFGELLDTAQREPVIITRRGRPVSLVLSVVNDIDALQCQFARPLSELAPPWRRRLTSPKWWSRPIATR